MSTMVMTGGTSGFGAITVGRLRCSGDTRLLLGARGMQEPAGSLPLDLTELESTRAFAHAVRDELAGVPIDALILNAGLVRADTDRRTADGFETTFAVNHLAHYLILRLLLPALADTATVVLTTSGTHDPATGAGLTPPRHADAALLAHPDRDPELDHRPRKAGEHAYTASKLCAVLTARALSEQEPAPDKKITAIAYCPGQVFGTGLARELPLHLRAAWSLMGSPVLSEAARRFDRTLNTRQDAANSLADLASGVTRPPAGRIYAALRGGQLTWPDPSAACSAEAARKLWCDSAELVGLPA
ncbi:SDR family NAD(P)-dependent oxidoreductase [Nocardia carnea]|uniref:SDR family NAD(P)-dependent oxidoreductase n=1 Tax=Nocardia carnea TaxID=37328 RepID=A0ABW7TKJ7_9NOCA|nr:SDR family NAD(P)-dependent oxidoreductase [Nocardia carnea]